MSVFGGRARGVHAGLDVPHCSIWRAEVSVLCLRERVSREEGPHFGVVELQEIIDPTEQF